MPKTNKNSNNNKPKPQPTRRNKRFFDGITVGFSLPGSNNMITTGDTKGGGGVTAGKNVPAAYGGKGTRNITHMMATQDSAVISGSDYLGQVSSNSNVQGDVRFTIPITPYMNPTSRLAAEALIYDKWRVRKLQFRYVTAVATSQAGQLIHYIDYDVTNTLVLSNPSNVSIAAAHNHNAATPVWANSTVQYEDRKSRLAPGESVWLFTSNNGADDRFDSAGLYNVVLATNVGGTVTLGSIYVDYEIELACPQAMSPNTGVVANLAAGSGTVSTYACPVGTVFNWTNNGIGLIYETGGGTYSQITWPKQLGTERYLVHWILQGATAYTGTPVITTTASTCTLLPAVSGGTVKEVMGGATASGASAWPGTSGSGGSWTQLIYTAKVQPSSPNTTMSLRWTITGGTGGGGANVSQLYVVPITQNVSRKPLKARVEELEAELAQLEERRAAVEAAHVRNLLTPGDPALPPLNPTHSDPAVMDRFLQRFREFARARAEIDEIAKQFNLVLDDKSGAGGLAAP